MAVRIGRKAFLRGGAALGLTAALGNGNLIELARERSVVAVDAYCASLLGLKAGDIIQIIQASEQGLGEIDLLKVGIREIRV
jgi:hypothetical protein